MKDTLVFGASLKPDRYSNMAIERLVGKEIATQAYGLQVGVIHGVQIKANLTDRIVTKLLAENDIEAVVACTLVMLATDQY